MRARFMVLLACVVLLVFGAVVLRDTFGYGRNSSDSKNSSMTVPIVATAEDDIPLYPGAEDVTISKAEPYDGRRMVYHTYANRSEVAAFYKEIMVKLGWTLRWENTEIQRELTFSYIRQDPQQAKPYDLIASITIRDPSTGKYSGDDLWPIFDGTPLPSPVPIVTPEEDKTKPDLGSYVDIVLDMEPNFDRIPLYPGAENVEIKGTPVGVDTNQVKRTTTYVVSATSQDIATYYKSTLVQYSWHLARIGESITLETLNFNWPGPGGGAVLTIRVEPTSEGRTKVTMELDGRKYFIKM